MGLALLNSPYAPYTQYENVTVELLPFYTLYLLDAFIGDMSGDKVSFLLAQLVGRQT